MDEEINKFPSKGTLNSLSTAFVTLKHCLKEDPKEKCIDMDLIEIESEDLMAPSHSLAKERENECDILKKKFFENLPYAARPLLIGKFLKSLISDSNEELNKLSTHKALTPNEKDIFNLILSQINTLRLFQNIHHANQKVKQNLEEVYEEGIWKEHVLFNGKLNGSMLEALNHIVSQDKLMMSQLAIKNWLEMIYHFTQEYHGRVDYVMTYNKLKSEQNGNAEITLDNVNKELYKKLHPTDREQNEKLLQNVFNYIRSGELNKAEELMIKCGQAGKSLMLSETLPFHDFELSDTLTIPSGSRLTPEDFNIPNSMKTRAFYTALEKRREHYDSKNETPQICMGNRNFLLSFSSLSKASNSSNLSEIDKAIFGALCGEIGPLLKKAHSTHDYLWAYFTNEVLNNMINSYKHCIRHSLKGRVIGHLTGIGSPFSLTRPSFTPTPSRFTPSQANIHKPYHDFPSFLNYIQKIPQTHTFKHHHVLENLQLCVLEAVLAEINQKYKWDQVLNHMLQLVRNNANNLQTNKGQPKYFFYLLKFCAHVLIFLLNSNRLKEILIPQYNEIITQYVYLLFKMDQMEEPIFYCGFLLGEEQILKTLSDYFLSIQDNQVRAESLGHIKKYYPSFIHQITGSIYSMSAFPDENIYLQKIENLKWFFLEKDNLTRAIREATKLGRELMLLDEIKYLEVLVDYFYSVDFPDDQKIMEDNAFHPQELIDIYEKAVDNKPFYLDLFERCRYLIEKDRICKFLEAFKAVEIFNTLQEETTAKIQENAKYNIKIIQGSSLSVVDHEYHETRQEEEKEEEHRKQLLNNAYLDAVFRIEKIILTNEPILMDEGFDPYLLDAEGNEERKQQIRMIATKWVSFFLNNLFMLNLQMNKYEQNWDLMKRIWELDIHRFLQKKEAAEILNKMAFVVTDSCDLVREILISDEPVPSQTSPQKQFNILQ